MESSAGDRPSKPSTLLRVTNVVGYILLITVNVCAGIGVLGKTNSDISNRWTTPLTPLGWAFSIWGLIFALQGCGVIYQALPQGYGRDTLKTAAVLAIGPLWQLGWIFESSWQLLFLLESKAGMVLCALCLIAALACFAAAVWRLYQAVERHKARLQKHQDHGQGQGVPPRWPELTFFQLATSINAAWLSVATCLGVLIAPQAFGVPWHLIQYMACGLAALVGSAGVSWLLWAGDFGYGATLLWASTALAPKYWADPTVHFVQLLVNGVLAALAVLSLMPRPSAPPRHTVLAAEAILSEEERASLLPHSLEDPLPSNSGEHLNDGSTSPASDVPQSGSPRGSAGLPQAT